MDLLAQARAGTRSGHPPVVIGFISTSAAAMPTFIFETEYAKSNRAACKACKGKVELGALKVGWRTPASEDQENRSHAAEAPKFHHISCFPKTHNPAWFKKHLPQDLDEVGGAANLTEADRGRLAAVFAACRGEGEMPEEVGELVSPGKTTPPGKKRKAPEDAKNDEPEDNETGEKRRKIEGVKDELSKKNAAFLQALLAKNGLPKSGKKEELLDRVAECRVLGVPPPCPTCSKAKLRWAWGKGFSCPGFFDDEAKRFVRCKGPEAGAVLERTPWQELI